MRWTALNGLGTLFWLAGLFMAHSVTHATAVDAWLPANPLPVGAALGVLGLATLLWANLRDA